MKDEVTEALANYLELSMALSVIPTMAGFGQFIVDSYDDKV